MSRGTQIKQALEDRLGLYHSVQAVFDSPDGERVIRYLCKVSGITKPKIITDPNLLLVRQGQQHIVLTLLNILGKDPNQIVNLIEEGLKNEE